MNEIRPDTWSYNILPTVPGIYYFMLIHDKSVVPESWEMGGVTIEENGRRVVEFGENYYDMTQMGDFLICGPHPLPPPRPSSDWLDALIGGTVGGLEMHEEEATV